MATVYIDASAGVKLVIEEAESAALREWLAGRPSRSSSAVFRTEVLRAVRRQEPAAAGRARKVIERVVLLAVDDGMLQIAAELDPAALRTLDALHLAAALRVRDDLDAIVTYAGRMIDAARGLGLPVASPR